MFNRERLLGLRPLLVFFLAYSLLFFLFSLTLPYTFPFVAGLLLAWAVQPLLGLLRGRLGLRPGAAAALATLLVYGAALALLALLGAWLAAELASLAGSLPLWEEGLLFGPLGRALEWLAGLLGRLDQDFLARNQRQLFSLLQSGAGMLAALVKGLLAFLTSLPALLATFLVTVLSTYFFSRDMGALRAWLRGFLSEKGAARLREASRHGAAIGGRWAASYLFLCFLTFLETLAALSLLGAPYPLLLSITAGLADLLPAVGPGAVYLPLAFSRLASGDWLGGLLLALCWLLVCALRQVLEPKLISSSVRIHPLAMLAALYFSVAAGSFLLLLYFFLLLALYQALARAGLLPRLGEEK